MTDERSSSVYWTPFMTAFYGLSNVLMFYDFYTNNVGKKIS
jgi:hypothetical protein